MKGTDRWRKVWRVLGLWSIAAAFAGPAAAEPVRVVATLPNLAALTREVVGEHGTVVTLASPRQDPHYVDARPNLILALNKADLLVVNGLDLEIGWLPRLMVAARNPSIQLGGDGYLDASTVVHRLQVPNQKIDRAMGDIHPGGNPHFTFDPRAARRITQLIAERLVRIAPEKAEHWRKNAARLDAELATLENTERERFGKLPPEKRRYVAYHQSFVYLRDWLGLDELATIEPRPGIPPNPGHVGKVLGKMKATGVRVILQEDFYPAKAAETLAQLTGGELVLIPGGARFDDGQRYVEHIAGITERLYAALSK